MDWNDEIRARFPDWGTDAALARWPSVRYTLSIGQNVRGEVIARAPFGVWVDIGVGHPALLLVPEMAGAGEKPITFEDYPELMTMIDARIMWLGDRAAISLSQRLQSKSVGTISREIVKNGKDGIAGANVRSLKLIRQRVDQILANETLNDEFSATSKAEAIEALIGEYGWEPIRECMFDLLRDDGRMVDWREVLHVFWGAVLDRRSLPADELIAWLYYRFDPEGSAEDNEVWSIASKLKGKSYLSKYKPLQDPGVLEHLKAIRDR